jgi:K+-sensing histidine kinase KdpD
MGLDDQAKKSRLIAVSPGRSVAREERGQFSMAFKSIAVFIDPTPAGQTRISYAVRMASRYGAHLIGIFVVPLVSGGSHSVAEHVVPVKTSASSFAFSTKETSTTALR